METLKVLEYCCYRKYLNEWYANRSSTEDTFTLVNYGDHTITELIGWCINMCFGRNADGTPSGASVTIAMPYIMQSTIKYLTKNKNITTLHILTTQPIDTPHSNNTLTPHPSNVSDEGGAPAPSPSSPPKSPTSPYPSPEVVIIPDLHTQLVTISGSGMYFVLQGNLLQSVCPGKYVTTLGITKRYYDPIHSLLESWFRVYTKKQK